MGRRWPAVLLALALVSAAPLLLVRFLPFTDLPEHVAAIAALARLLPGGGGDSDYVIAFRESQYLLYDLLAALLTRLLGDAVLANRLVLAGIALAWPFAFRHLLRALGRDERLAIFAPMLFWSRALTIGFLPFLGSVPLLLVALATFIEQLERPTRARGARLAVLAVVLFYAHVSTYVLLGAIGGTMVIFNVAFARSADPRSDLWLNTRRALRQGVSAFACLLPSAACAGYWWSGASLGQVAGQRERISHLPPGVAIEAAPIWAFDLWRSHLDEVWAVLFWIAFALVVIDGLRTKPDAASLRRGAFALLPFACTAVVYMVTPFNVGAAGFLDVRLAPLLALFGVLPLRPPPAAKIAPAAMVLAALAGVGTATSAAFEMRRLEREMLGDFESLLGAMRPNTRLATLNFETRSPRAYFWPYVFVGGYHRLKPGTIAAYSFAELPHWPIHYTPGQAPPKRADFWTYHPCEFRRREDGVYYDYVLVQGRHNPFAASHPGPRFEPIARAGVFTLFAKASGAADMSPDTPDQSVCRPRTPAPSDEAHEGTYP